MVIKASGGINVDEATKFGNGFFKLLNSFGSGEQKPNESNVGEFFTSDCIFESNGAVRAKGLEEIAARWKKAQNFFSKFAIAGFVEGPFTDGTHVFFRYNVDVTEKNGTHGQIQVFAFFTFEGGKVAAWSQVAHEKETGSWDA